MSTENSTLNSTLTPAERRYENRLESLSSRLAGWRTPERRALLVRLNWISLAIMATISVASYFWIIVAIAWIPMTIVICTVWTMLRTVIDCKDEAPARYLDEFETRTLLDARSTALKILIGLLVVIGFILIYFSVTELGDGHRLAYSVGGLAILGVFVGGIVPAAAMATIMDPVDED